MTRKQHSARFKAKVAVEAIRGVRGVNEVGCKFGVHPVQVSHWKRQALDGLPEVFSSRRGPNGKHEAEVQAELYQQIGRLKMGLEWVKKKCGVAD